MFLQKSLYLSNSDSNKLCLSTYPSTFSFDNNTISSQNLYLSILDNNLTLATESNWEHINWFLKHSETGLYICCDLEYNLYLSLSANDAIPLVYSNNTFIYTKPKLRYDFDLVNATKNIPRFVQRHDKSGLKIGILLAGGFSTRFQSSQFKQMHKINDKPVIWHSLDILETTMDYVIITTNSSLSLTISQLIQERPKIKVVVNDINCRLKSIETALLYIRENYEYVSYVILHDSARPFITVNYIQELQRSCDIGNLYSQYYMKLVNGLLKKNYSGFEEVNRDEYIEICTPICSDFELFYYVFMNYIANPENRICYEIIPLLNIMKVKYNLIEGFCRYLRKITVSEDVY